MTYSAFSGTTANPGSSTAAGSVVLTDNDGGNAMLSLTSAMPNDTDISCIRVSYSGTASATVRMYGTISGALAPYLNLTVTRGTDSSPSWDSCTNFTADATNYRGLGAGVLYDGTLANFPTSFPAALADPASTTAAETWTSGEAHSYRFQVTLQNDTGAQGLTGSAGFTWEARNTVTGFATQLDGTMGCISESGTSGDCADGTRLNDVNDIAISPDGSNLYIVARADDAVLAFSRDTTTGRLTQLAGTAGCISETGSGGACTDGKALDRPHGITVSPDGKHVYVASWDSDAVAVLSRDLGTGALSQAGDTSGCVSETGSGGTCADGKGLVDAVYITTSPDGASVYATAYSSNGIAAFSRNQTSGALTQLAGLAGCVTDNGTGGTCTDGTTLQQAIGITVSPDGRNVYMTASADTHDAVAVFSRDTGTGALTQLGGLNACVSETGSGGTCTDVYGLDGPFSVVVSPDGRNVYAAATWGGGVAAFNRNQSTGALTQMAGTTGCISESGTGGSCVDGKGLHGARKLVMSPDGESIYVVAEWIDAIAALSRDPFSGQLSQSATASGCVSETGAGPCLDGKGMDGLYGVAIDPSGRTVYAAAWSSAALLTFRRQG